MIKIYETFEELAEAMCDGAGLLHAYNCAHSLSRFAPEDLCTAWQSGVVTFAEWLDHIGVKVKILDDAEDFYSFCAKKAEK